MEIEETARLQEFYLRYYSGHKGRFGHEFLEFEIKPNSKLRYANNSHYKNDGIICKEVFLNTCVVDEFKRIINDSEILKEDDTNWPDNDKGGRQELEIVFNNVHINFVTN
ncbi:MAG: putative protein mago nashi, partial [Streblomastix strix]